MKKVIIALVIIAAVVGVVLYVKSKKKDTAAEDGKKDPAGESGAAAGGAASAPDGTVYKNKTLSPEQAVSGLKTQKGGTVVSIKKANPNFNPTRKTTGATNSGR